MVEARGWTDLSDGDEFAGYRIERRLGRGGMGILYLAVEPGLDRRVALKLIAPEAAADEVFARRFAEESRIAASIEHPNVVPIYAAGKEAGVPFIAMRYVAGSDLSKRLAREGRLGPARAVTLIAQLGNGLDAIHAAGLVHRDVKPANVLLSGEEGAEHAYITDFGVARNVATQSGLTQTGRFVGTLDYVAPEQISGGEVDARADVYALGCLLFKLLTGQVPYPRDGEAARLYAHLNDPPPAPSLYAPEVSMALDDVVIRAMSKQPDDRYPSAGDLGRAAVAALSGSPVAVPERTVATGAAATRTAETMQPAPTTETLAPDPPGRRAAAGRRRALALRRRRDRLDRDRGRARRARRLRRWQGRERDGDHCAEGRDGAEAGQEAGAQDADEIGADLWGRRDLQREPGDLPRLPGRVSRRGVRTQRRLLAPAGRDLRQGGEAVQRAGAAAGAAAALPALCQGPGRSCEMGPGRPRGPPKPKTKRPIWWPGKTATRPNRNDSSSRKRSASPSAATAGSDRAVSRPCVCVRLRGRPVRPGGALPRSPRGSRRSPRRERRRRPRWACRRRCRGRLP